MVEAMEASTENWYDLAFLPGPRSLHRALVQHGDQVAKEQQQHPGCDSVELECLAGERCLSLTLPRLRE